MKKLIAPLVCSLAFATLQAQEAAPSPTPAAVPDDVQQQLIMIEEATNYTADKSKDVVLAAVKKYCLPEFKAMFAGRVLTLDQVLKVMEMDPNPPLSSSIHDRQFLRKGDTIVVYGLYDRTEKIGGEVKTLKNARYMDLFVQVDGEWKLLMGVNEPPAPAAPAKP